MRFLNSVFGALVDRSSDELIGALLVATVVAGVMAGLYALGRRRASNPAVFVGGLVLASEVFCMALTTGYYEYRAPSLGNRGPTPFQPAWADGQRTAITGSRRQCHGGTRRLAGHPVSTLSSRRTLITTATSRRRKWRRSCRGPTRTVTALSTSLTSTAPSRGDCFVTPTQPATQPILEYVAKDGRGPNSVTLSPTSRVPGPSEITDCRPRRRPHRASTDDSHADNQAPRRQTCA